MDSAATISLGPIPGDAYLGSPRFRVGLRERGLIEEEYFLSGMATAYAGGDPIAEHGRVTARPAGTAPYTTRVIVRRPADPGKFNGSVLVEWLNVSAGTDGAPDFSYLHRQIVRAGYAWVGVSAQRAGLEGIPGMPVIAQPVKSFDPARYAALAHPGDAYAFDIYSQAGAALRRTGADSLLRGLVPRQLLAIGESQSAFFLVTYVNAIDPLAAVYDGFLIHARGGVGATLEGLRLPKDASGYFSQPVRIREDVRVPVLTVQSETDLIVLGSLEARQPDGERLRLWEIAGAAHADTYLLNAATVDAEDVDAAQLAAALAPTDTVMGMRLGACINAGPQQHYVMNAALEALRRWVHGGDAPACAPRLATVTAPARGFVVDENGIVRGGIRSPWVEVPTAALSGLGQSGPGFAPLFGTTRAFDSRTLRRLYPRGLADFEVRFADATESSIRAGFILESDRAEIRAVADLHLRASPLGAH